MAEQNMHDITARSDAAISRRGFLARAGFAAAGLAVAGSTLATGADAAPNAHTAGLPVRIGSGYYTYELVPEWGTLPAPMKYGWGVGIVVDSRDRIYIHSRNPQAIVVFDREGKLLDDWGAEFAATGHGLYWHKEGRDEFLYFTDHPRNLVVKTDLQGRRLLRIGDVPYESSTSIKFGFNQPTDLAISPNGDLYVCEGYGGNMVHQFTKEGKFIRTIGKPGKGPGEFNCPHGIWVDTRKAEPELYVADRNNARLQVLTLDGQHKRFLGEDVRQPCCFYTHKGKMYIPDLDHRVTVLDENDKPLAQLGDGRMGVTDATFEAPHALTVDSHGDLYVIEWRADSRVRKFKHTPA